ncbi:TRAP transporter small permease [Photobacterium satsumensis]|uniref:TRAP transporter small permease n=1 Tax=Photobacterium satsumensis TaxID=2910239 RepID=UPI003D1063F4
MVNLEIISRSFFAHSFTWVEETAKYVMVWVAFIGGICASRKSAHPSITTILDRLQGKWRKSLELFVYVISIFTLVSMAKFGFDFAETGKMLRMSTLSDYSMYAAYLAIPVGCIGMTLVIVEKILCQWLINDDAVDIASPDNQLEAQ